MINENKFFNDNFFIIASDNLKSVEPRLYGYAFLNDKILINSHNCNYQIPNNVYGCYVNVTKSDSEIKLFQDYFGSYGIYVYQEDNYFAISNSFIYLVNYLKKVKILSFNYQFAKNLISPPTATLAYQNTMVDKIKMLPRNYVVKINIANRSLKYEEIEQREEYINVDTKEAIQLLDEWHFKWNSVFESLAGKNFPITLKLSGGKDSRIVLSSFYSPKIKSINKISFFSAIDKLHIEDFNIASTISKILNFTLSPREFQDRYKMDPMMNLKSSLYTKGGFHREIMPTHFWKKKPSFTVTGSVGGLRDFWNEKIETFIESNISNVLFHSIDCKTALKNELLESAKKVKEKYNGKNLNARMVFYNEIRCRNQYGKANAESFLANEVIIAPLLDPMLYKLNQNIGQNNDYDLLYAIILDRYLKELKNVPFDSNRVIIKESLNIAQEINRKFPFTSKKNTKNIEYLIDYARVVPDQSSAKNSTLDVLKDIFESSEVKNVIYDEFGEEVYNWAIDYYKNAYHPYMAAAALVEIYCIYSAVMQSQDSSCISKIDFPIIASKNSNSKNYFNDGIMKHIYKYLSSLRIEFKNIGEKENSITIEESDDNNMFFENPKWLTDDLGKGLLIQSCKNKLKLNLKIKNDGKLNLKLKGAWLKDNDGAIVPIKIDITKFQLFINENSEKHQILSADGITVVDSINFKTIEIPCKNEQNLILDVEWLPHIYNDEDLFNLIKIMKQKNINYYLFWNKD